MTFIWSEAKRRSNLKNHALDFRDAPKVFAGATFTFEDDRFNYGEKRYVTLGAARRYPRFDCAHGKDGLPPDHFFSKGNEA